ncbi:RNA-directed DNA methylation 4 isoform X2 [Prosopis cineraria]|nr:RNA-directed DNA methylation 4 isoform X2 [Prosopis cineraria]XP_054788241.1 RNA-directed DNA methylation 4 isoform X2 [Prosopis cineraria]XP_054788248.1 RNA-directed DNA methylation 4 isoform X2 [Prosopis cineraria]XP_054788256.1 RNA-directed DNA methylation 4 isoform X2 [Prosopis cineraria]
MATVGESSSAAATSKPVVVRVKRKSFQSPIDAFWLEINERPLKRPLVDFANLSISDSNTQKEELNTKKVFVQHVETISVPEVTFDVVQFFVESGSNGACECKSKLVERKELFKKGNKQDQLLLKAKEKHESTAKNARFEQIWKSRRGNKESVHAKELQEICQFYDIVRVDEEKNNKAQQEHMSLEDQRLLCSYLPLLREFIPNAAAEIESDMRAHYEQDNYVYDIYAVNEEMDITVEDATYSYPLVQVDEEDYYDGPEESDCESDDSNAENNPLNDYPDEISEEEDEDNEASDNDSDECESKNASDESSEEDFRHVSSKDDTDLLIDEDFDDDYDAGNHDVDGVDGNEDLRWSCR